MNGYARSAQIQYEKTGAKSEDYVELFLLKCGDDDLMDFIYPQRLVDIYRVEQFISHRLQGEKRKNHQDRMSNSLPVYPHRYESRINRRRDSRNDSTRRSESRRDNNIGDHRFHHRERRDGQRLDHRYRRENTESSVKTDNLGAKDGHGDTSTIVAAVSPSHRQLRTICGLQLNN